MGRGADSPSHRSERFLFLVLIVVIHDLVVGVIVLLAALGAGVSAALRTLGTALGARKDTFAGLAGMGDLIVTCTSMNSRNYRAGILIGQGTPVQEAIRKIGAVVEGYYAVDSARELAAQVGVEMPITLAAYDVLYRDRDPREVLLSLMRREKRHEIEETWF